MRVRLKTFVIITCGLTFSLWFVFTKSEFVILRYSTENKAQLKTPNQQQNVENASNINKVGEKKVVLQEEEEEGDFSSPIFQNVDDINETFVYSAFYDNRSAPIITVIAIVKSDLPPDLYMCLMDSSDAELPATLEYIPEPSWKYKYRGGIIKCSLPVSPKPKFIFIVKKSQLEHNPNFKSQNKLKVNYPDKYGRNFTRCVPAFHDFNATTELIQMIESDLIFGMEHFIMYKFTANDPNLQQVLKSYQDDGILTLYEWNLPVPTKDIHYFGQMANMHDCLYRNMFVSRYVFIADVDEIVVSSVYPSWHNMTQSILKRNPTCSAISFKNAFFPTYFTNDNTVYAGKEEAARLNLTFLLKTTHTKMHAIGDRSKLLVKPETIKYMWIHGVDKFYEKQWKTCPVHNPRDALLHHYRSKPALDMRLPYKTDQTFLKLSEPLIMRIKSRLMKVFYDQNLNSLNRKAT